MCIAAALALALPVLADDWVERNEHKDGSGYHVHAFVKAWAYMGADNQCHYNQWEHTIGDTSPGDHTATMDWSNSTESPWTRTELKDSTGSTVDEITATLTDYTTLCPA